MWPEDIAESRVGDILQKYFPPPLDIQQWRIENGINAIIYLNHVHPNGENVCESARLIPTQTRCN